MHTIDRLTMWQIKNLPPIITSDAYQEWVTLVDLHLLEAIGITRDQLPDQLYRDWFDAGRTAQEACDETLSNINIFNPSYPN